MKKRITTLALAALAPLLFSVGAGGCGASSVSGGGSEGFSVGGVAVGLSGTLILQNNGGDDLTLTEDGAFGFAVRLDKGDVYDVSVKEQPSGQRCTVSNGSGTVSGDVTDVTVGCVANKIVFDSTRNLNGSDSADPNGNHNVWIMNVDGSGLEPLTHLTMKDAGQYLTQPIWSPRGDVIAFHSTQSLDGKGDATSSQNVWVIKPDGTGMKALTSIAAMGVYASSAVWSPDGGKIYFSSSQSLDGSDAANDGFTANIWSVNADGTDLVPVTQMKNTGDSNINIRFSPDGSKLLFSSTRKLDGSDDVNANGTANIWVSDLDGGSAVPLTSVTASGAGCYAGEFSPDGERIIYISRRDVGGNDATTANFVFNVWIMDANGDNQMPVAPSTAAGADSFGAWSNDGRKILMSSSRDLDGNDAANNNFISNLWTVNPDGSELTPVTDAKNDGDTSLGIVHTTPDPNTVFLVSSRKLDGTDAVNANGTKNIWSIGSDGSGLKPLTQTTAAGANSDAPRLRP